jgi:hypothetical protein
MKIKEKYYHKKILNLLKEYNDNFGLLNESKKEILMDKLGLNEDLAQVFDEIGKKLSVWLANKYLKYYYDNNINLINYGMTKTDVLKAAKKKINELHPQRMIPVLASIMDYIQVGLNGNKSSLEDLNIVDIITKSKEWHDSLNVGDGTINYVEPKDHTVVIDFRKDGEGYYWVALNTKNSEEECKRMGHCGRSSYGYLYSLRSDKKLPGGKFKLNRSHLTAAIGTDGIMYQLKGPKNSKPKEEYHQYITPLFSYEEDGDYLIQGFGTEYASQQDFKLSDLPNETIKELYNERPELFNTRGLQRKLGELGIIEVPPLQTTFTLEIEPKDVGDYLEGDYVYRRIKSKTPAGNDTSRKVYFYETIMSDDVWDMWGSFSDDWKSALEYNVDSENEKKIEEIINSMIEKQGVEVDEDMSLEDKIEEYDENYDIRNAINGSINEAESNEYVEYLRDTIKDALNDLGNVFEFTYDKIKIQIDLKDHLSDSQIDEYFEHYEGCNENPNCVFSELTSEDIIELPKPKFDDRWYPDIDKNTFNEYLKDSLNDI